MAKMVAKAEKTAMSWANGTLFPFGGGVVLGISLHSPGCPGTHCINKMVSKSQRPTNLCVLNAGIKVEPCYPSSLMGASYAASGM